MKQKLTEQDFIRAAQQIKCEVAAIKAVCEVEAPNGGFLEDGQCTILFERHKFYQFTHGKYFATHPDICNPKAGGYGAAGQHQHNRLAEAAALDRDAALMSCSWGKFQIMGYNFRLAGFEMLQDFLNAMLESEGKQLDAFISFVLKSGLSDELKRHDWKGFARGYNGAAYAKNKYDIKLKSAFLKYSV